MKNRALLRGGAALLAALAVVAFVLHSTARQRLYPEVLLTQNVPLGSQIAAQDLGLLWTTAVPSGAVNTTSAAIGRYAQVPLYAGETLTAAQVGPPPHAGPGQVQLVVPVSAAQSALASVGDTVTVYASRAQTGQPLASVTEIVAGVRVIGAYTSAGVPITPQAPGTPALVALAVTPAQVSALLPYVSGQGSSLYLVKDR